MNKKPKLLRDHQARDPPSPSRRIQFEIYLDVQFVDRTFWFVSLFAQAVQPPLRSWTLRKWREFHKSFIKKNNISDADLKHPLANVIKNQGPDIGLTEREIDASVLGLAFLAKRGPLKQLYVGPVGDSLRFMKFRTQLHPCLLPSKKYLYLVNGEAVLNKSAVLPMLLQGLSAEELQMCGLAGHLSFKQAQELAGNAFTSNVLVTILLGVLLNYRPA